MRRRLGIYEPADGVALDNLLQSHTGVIRVFPTVPDDFEGGFENLGAQGAFVLGAERGKAGVISIKLRSLAGNPCALANPWFGRDVKVTDLAGGEVAGGFSGPVARFETVKGRDYVIEPRQV